MMDISDNLQQSKAIRIEPNAGNCQSVQKNYQHCYHLVLQDTQRSWMMELPEFEIGMRTFLSTIGHLIPYELALILFNICENSS